MKIMLEKIKQEVLCANKMIQTTGLAILTWGNISGYDRESGFVVIKGSGIPYESMTEKDLAVVELETGKTIGDICPSTDLNTHLELYRNFPEIRGVAHTHSCYATIWAQAGRDIPCLGTTHADYFMGSVPCTRALRPEEVRHAYELNTGKVIVETLKDWKIHNTCAILVRKHGPFAWGSSAQDALHNALILENVAKMACFTEILGANEGVESLDFALLDKHYNRKFGVDAYYGQKKGI